MPAGKSVFMAREKLVLASTSPRRKQLLESLGIPFTAFSPNVAEPEPEPFEAPGEFSLRCAELKNRACEISDAVVLSADTIVSIDGKILGKPENDTEALAMLHRLNGRTHTVFTSFCLRGFNNRMHSEICSASVTFAKWPEETLLAYVNTGECLDKAGAYAVQGREIGRAVR